MERDESITVDDLDRPGGKGLAESYELHDVGHEAFLERCEEIGLEVAPWGIDERDDGGEDGLIYDDKLDFKVFGEVSHGIGVAEKELVALVDVKTKSSAEWMGQFNLRHYEDYVDRADELGVPTFVIMFQINDEEITDEFVTPIHEVGEEGVLRSDTHGYVSTFPDGNHKVVIPHRYRLPFDVFEAIVT